MIHKYQTFELLGKTVLEHMVADPPVRAVAAMQNEACLIYAVNGQSMAYGPQTRLPIKTGDAIVMKCGNYLNMWQVTPDNKPLEAMAIHFYPDVLRLVFDNKIPDFLKDESTGAHLDIEPVVVDKMMQQYVDSLQLYFDTPSLLTDDLIILKVRELILLLVKTNQTEGVKHVLRDLFNPTRLDFRQVIEHHLFDNLNVEDLATLTSQSVSSFKRNFKAVFNDSPARYIKTKRLEKAADLLLVSESRITEIAYDCGFNDVGHFSKSFHAHYKCSPSDYREKKGA